MRLAVLPLDSRPPNYVVPAQLAAIARAEALLPPRDSLGTLHGPADREFLLNWLTEAAQETQAAVFSWDALAYGGLVQSRADAPPLPPEQIEEALQRVDWRRCAGYMYVVVPRLGLTVTDAVSWETSRKLATYFAAWGEAQAEQGEGEHTGRSHLALLEAELGPHLIERAWALRRRNFSLAREAIRIAARLGLRSCHVSVEDNAPSGPHLLEVSELRKSADASLKEHTHLHAGASPLRCTFFDGADECASLFTARALLDTIGAPAQPVRLSLFPAAPGPEQYVGLYESQTLDSGLHFLSRFLDLPFRADARAQWLVCYGKQPQPDVFASGPDVFNNPYLLPGELDGDEPLYVTDLAACNGGNPHLAVRLGELGGERLCGISAWNTNFNALGLSAATIAVCGLPEADSNAAQRLLLERLADDYAYQSIARQEVVERCRLLRLDPLDFSDVTEGSLAMLETVCRSTWRAWADGPAAKLLSRIGVTSGEIAGLGYRFPWSRAFEAEVSS